MTWIETIELPLPRERAWQRLVVDQEILQLAPGLSLSPGGRGTLRVVLGGHSVSYRGYARQHVEEAGRHVTWTLSGKEMRGEGRAHAEIRARFKEGENGTTALRLTVLVDGRGKIADKSEVERDEAVHAVIAKFRRTAARDLEEAAAPPPPPAWDQPAPELPVQPGEALGGSVRPQLEVVPSQRERFSPGWAVPAAAGAVAAAGAALVLWRALTRRR